MVKLIYNRSDDKVGEICRGSQSEDKSCVDPERSITTTFLVFNFYSLLSYRSGLP